MSISKFRFILRIKKLHLTLSPFPFLPFFFFFFFAGLVSPRFLPTCSSSHKNLTLSSFRMVHRWLSLQNDRFRRPCMHRRVTRIFRDPGNFFYGDYELDIYVGTKNDYFHMEDVLRKVMKTDDITNMYGFLRNLEFEGGGTLVDRSIESVVFEMGHFSMTSTRNLFPRRETFETRVCIEFRNTGNDKMFACETERFFYVIFFATS